MPTRPPESLGGGYVLYTDGVNTFCEDSLRLASFAPARSPAADLCTGCGVVALLLHQKGCKVTAFEIDPAAAALAEKSARESGTDIRVVCADVRDIEGRFSLVTCNPPYFKESRSPVRRRNEIRSELLLSPDELFAAVDRILAPDGVFCFCHRAERFDELKEKLAAHGLTVSRTEFVRSKEENPPYLVLIEAKKENR